VRAYFDASGQPRVELEVRGSRAAVRVAAVLDTGFDGELSLPVAIAVQLGLELRDVITVELAGGTLSDELVFAGYLIDEGQETIVSILLAQSRDALLGTGLLRARRLVLDFGTSEAEIVPSQG
jgi:clan AA aspartic protease